MIADILYRYHFRASQSNALSVSVQKEECLQNHDSAQLITLLISNNNNNKNKNKNKNNNKINDNNDNSNNYKKKKKNNKYVKCVLSFLILLLTISIMTIVILLIAQVPYIAWNYKSHFLLKNIKEYAEW